MRNEPLRRIYISKFNEPRSTRDSRIDVPLTAGDYSWNSRFARIPLSRKSIVLWARFTLSCGHRIFLRIRLMLTTFLSEARAPGSSHSLVG